MDKKYTLQMTFTFTGKVIIKASSRSEAKELAEKHIGLVMGGRIETTLDDEDADWDFPIHPDKAVK